MATSRPFVKNTTGSNIPGTTQFGNIAVSNNAFVPADAPAGEKWWMGPDESLGHIIPYEVPAGTRSTALPGEFASFSFLRSAEFTEASFINLAEYFTRVKLNNPQTFATGALAKTWLQENGYWTSFSDTWTYNSSTNLSWPASSTGYTKYTGGVTSIDDGYTNSPIIAIDAFKMNGQSPSTSVYVSTNGYVTIGSGSGNIISTPQQQSSPPAIAGNPSDNWLQAGLTNNDGDVQDIYYQTGGVSGKSYLKFLIYCGAYGSQTTPRSYILNLYIDQQYQWVETRAKSNAVGNAGPYNIPDVSQASSTTSKVWRGDLNGQNWVYLGTGSITE